LLHRGEASSRSSWDWAVEPLPRDEGDAEAEGRHAAADELGARAVGDGPAGVGHVGQQQEVRAEAGGAEAARDGDDAPCDGQPMDGVGVDLEGLAGGGGPGLALGVGGGWFFKGRQPLLLRRRHQQRLNHDGGGDDGGGADDDARDLCVLGVDGAEVGVGVGHRVVGDARADESGAQGASPDGRREAFIAADVGIGGQHRVQLPVVVDGGRRRRHRRRRRRRRRHRQHREDRRGFGNSHRGLRRGDHRRVARGRRG